MSANFADSEFLSIFNPTCQIPKSEFVLVTHAVYCIFFPTCKFPKSKLKKKKNSPYILFYPFFLPPLLLLPPTHAGFSPYSSHHPVGSAPPSLHLGNSLILLVLAASAAGMIILLETS